MVRGSLVVAEPKGPCDSRVTAVHVVVMEYPGDNGCFVLEVRADQNVPNAVPETDVARIVETFRTG